MALRMLKAAAILLFTITASVTSFADPQRFTLDDFEDADPNRNPEWWSFDRIELGVVKHPPGKSNLGRHSLSVLGQAKDWYVGGLGTYLAKKDQDLSIYSVLELDIRGRGADSGRIKFELIDDDNGNWKVEQDKDWIPLSDDRFVFELSVDWKGWKHVRIPFTKFKVDNPGRGDGIWNPTQAGGSGGLLQLQLIAIGSSSTGDFNVDIDNVALGP